MFSTLRPALLLTCIAYASRVIAHPASFSYQNTTGQPDYVIVGGGAAGFVLAEMLSRNQSVTVVLLEAGPENAGVEDIDVPAFAGDIGGPQLWNYTSVPQPNNGNRNPEVNQGRGFGGGTAVNFLLGCRGAPSLFDQWAEISGDDGLAWANFENDFKATAHYQEEPVPYDTYLDPSAYGDGPLELTTVTSLDAGQGEFINGSISVLGVPHADLNSGIGIGVSISTNPARASNRTRDYSAQAWGWQLASRPNAQQIYNAEATHIGFDGTTAVNVTYVNPLNNQTTVLSPKEIILSAGAIGSPKLLMLSGVGPAAELTALDIPVVADISDVGQNLYDHLCGVLEYEVVPEVQTLWQITENTTDTASADQEYSVEHTGPLGNPIGSALATFRAPDSVFSAVNDTFHPALPDDRPQLLIQYAAAPLMGGLPNVSVVSPFVALVQPESSGNVTLISNDYHDKPIINSNYFGSPGDQAAILYGYKQMRQVFESPEYAPLVVQELYPGPNVTSDADLFQALADSSISFHHPMGTLSLGKVIEGTTFRVKGLQGIRVVDSSTFPYPTTCQPMMTVYAFANHAGNLIVEQDSF